MNKVAAIPLFALLTFTPLSARQAAPDSSIAPTDSTTRVDSLRTRFIPGIGIFRSLPDSADVLHASRWAWSEDRLVENLFWKIPGLYSTSLGEAGKPVRLYYQGLDSRSLSFFLDGRPIGDAVTGEVNPADIPLEFMEAAEFLANGQNPAGGIATLNAVSRQDNSPRPMTKLRYVQNPFETLLTDALFSQNIARSTNLVVGLQRYSSRGRYKHGGLDSWNTRVRLRYNISPSFNVSLQHLYTADRNEMNGGVDLALSNEPFEEARAIVQTETGHETLLRSDWTLAGAAKLFADSLSLTRFSLYSSSTEREYQNFGDDYHLANERDADAYSVRGVRASQRFAVSPGATIEAGFQIAQTDLDQSSTLRTTAEDEYSFFGSVEFAPIDFADVSLSARSDSRAGLNATAIRGAVRLYSSLGKIWASAEQAGRIPTLQERLAVDSLFSTTAPLSNESRNSFAAGVDGQPLESLSLQLSAFHHRIEQAVVFRSTSTASGTPAVAISNIPDLTTTGALATAHWRWNGFEALGVACYTEYREQDTVQTPFPDLFLAGELSYRDVVLKDALDGKIGVRAKFLNRQQGVDYHPRVRAYTLQQTYTFGRVTILDAFLVFHLGDAMISISWENLLNFNYYLLPFYPAPERHIQLGVNWRWID